MNQDAITASYCINIDKPEMMCNAKCYISKILTNHSTNNMPRFINNMKTDIVFFLDETPPFSLENINTLYSPRKLSYKPLFYARMFNSPIDHPPKV